MDAEPRFVCITLKRGSFDGLCNSLLGGRYSSAHDLCSEEEFYKCRILVQVAGRPPMKDVLHLIQSMGSAGERRGSGGAHSGIGLCAPVLKEITSPDRIEACLRTTVLVERTGAGGRGRDDDVLTVYPPHGKDRYAITRADFNTLNPGEYLNDTIIDFHLKHLEQRLQQSERSPSSPRFTFVNTFFYTKLRAKPTRHSKGAASDTLAIVRGLRKWAVQGRDRRSIFAPPETDGEGTAPPTYLVIPINEDLHWSLAVVAITARSKGEAAAARRVEVVPAAEAAAAAAERRAGRSPSPDAHSVKQRMGIGGLVKTAAMGFGKAVNDLVSSQSASEGGDDDTSGDEDSDPGLDGGAVEMLSDNDDAQPPESDAAAAADPTPKVQLLWFDSFGRKNPQAWRKLVKFLNFAWHHYQGSISGQTAEDIDGSLDTASLETPWQYSPTKEPGPGKEKLPVVKKLVPQQPNSHDCGVYLLQYAENFTKDADEAAKISPNHIQQFHDRGDFTDWFKRDDLNTKRQIIQTTIMSLSEGKPGGAGAHAAAAQPKPRRRRRTVRPKAPL